MKKLLICTLTTIAFAAIAAAGELVNIDKTGLALQGYDPVAYFTVKKPTPGKPQFTATYKGARYQFANAENKASFEKKPSKYEPQFSGFCGYAASIDKISPISPEFWQVLGGRLVLQHNEKALGLWTKDVPGNLKKADSNWPHLKERKR